MLLSRLFTKTSKVSASDVGSVNADLLTRGGFIHKTMAGVYSYLPLGVRVLQKIEQIVREEMDKIGNEVFLPSLSPSELWERTGRMESVDVLFAAAGANDLSRKKNDATYVLNSTHEEVITPIVQHFCTSYKDFPCAAYQIQTKFRNEARAKSGIMRGREFRMKDLYSFDRTEEAMLEYFHHKATSAYQKVFERVGLGDRTIIALASGGDFSKEPSREFQTRCETGEDHIFHDTQSGVFYNREITPSKAPPWGDPSEKELPRKDVLGKGIIGVEELAEFLKIEVERTTKTLIFEAEGGRIIAAAVRGDYDVNELKLREIAKCSSLALATAATVKRVTKAEVGYAGPIGLPKSVEVYWDESTEGRKNFECGANKTNEHSVNVNFGRDVPEPKEFYDFKIAKEGDVSPTSGKPYEVFRAAEVGNIFTLYTKFSDAFGFLFTDEDGKQKPVYMGSYGIGTTRIMGVLAEIFHDDHGLLWPAAVAPARVHIIPLAKSTDEESYCRALSLYEELMEKGIDCLFDDRLEVSVGSRLADADLIGVPLRIVVSAKSLKAGGYEVKERRGSSVDILDRERVLALFS